MLVFACIVLAVNHCISPPTLNIRINIKGMNLYNLVRAFCYAFHYAVTAILSV